MKSDGSRPFNPGLARHRLRLWKPVKGKDPIGGDIVTPHLVATVRARVEYLAGRELDTAQQKWADARYKVTFQYLGSIEREWWIEWMTASNVRLDIRDVADLAGVSNCIVLIVADHHAR